MANEKETKLDLTQLEILKEFARELKKPDEETQAKLEAEKARKEANRKSMVEAARQEIAYREAGQAACNHHNGGHPTFAGQRCTNGDFTAHCLRCQVEYRWNYQQQGAPGSDEGFQLSEVLKGLPVGIAERQLEKTEQVYPPQIRAKRKGSVCKADLVKK